MTDDEARTLQAQLHRLRRAQRRELAPVAGLSRTSTRVLAVVARGGGSATPGDAAQELAMASSNVATALRELDEAGLVRRHRDETDRRRVTVELTDRGAQVVAEHRSLRAQWLRTAVEAGLDADEQALLVAAGHLLDRVAAQHEALVSA